MPGNLPSFSNRRKIFHPGPFRLRRAASLPTFLCHMTQQTTEIEVEVVEIDGVAPAAPQARTGEREQPQRGDWQDWRKWQGRILKLNSRWWPLWVFLGIIAVALALTIGVVIGVIFLVFRMLANLVRAILR